MKPSRAIELVLTVLQSGAETSLGLIGIFGMSKKELFRTINRQDDGFRFETDWALTYRDHQKFHALLQHLKQQGLIQRKSNDVGSSWSITAKGRGALPVIRKRNLYSAETAAYRAVEDTMFKIITYDIPATRDGQSQRQWLRIALNNLGFTLLQKSVWVGKQKIPEEFMRGLRERKLLPHVQVFAVNRSGTLQELE